MRSRMFSLVLVSATVMGATEPALAQSPYGATAARTIMRRPSPRCGGKVMPSPAPLNR
jgi:hypothetical protein